MASKQYHLRVDLHCIGSPVTPRCAFPGFLVQILTSCSFVTMLSAARGGCEARRIYSVAICPVGNRIAYSRPPKKDKSPDGGAHHQESSGACLLKDLDI